MIYVSVLTSSNTDLYYEQALMLAYSFRVHMPNENLTFLVDNKTYDTFTEKRTALKKYATQIISVPFDEDVDTISRSRLIKTSITKYIEDDFVFMDCDMIVCEDLSEIQNFDCDIAAVLDCHVLLDEHIHKENFLNRDIFLGFHGTEHFNCNYNGGFIFVKQSEKTKKFYEKWNELWQFSKNKRGEHHDQPSFHEALYQSNLKIKELDGIWNCQPSSGGLEFLGNAKIIHYFSSEFVGKNYVPYYKLADKRLQQRIKEFGDIPDDVKEMIKNPKFQFNKVYLIKDQRIVNIMQSPLIFTFAEMKIYAPWLFRLFESLAAFIRTVGKIVLRRGGVKKYR